VIRNREGVFVVDITVRHEDGDYLEKGRLEKVEKYSTLLPSLQNRFEATTSEILPVVVGTRGAMPKLTIEALKRLQIADKPTLLTISMIAHRSSIEIYNTFMDYDGRRTTVSRYPRLY
jgi:hypothetical protein